MTTVEETRLLCRVSLGAELDVRSVGEVLGALDRAERSSVKAFVLDTAGDAFCAGMSLRDLEEQWRPRVTAIHGLLTRLLSSPLITVALVNGAALGGGTGLAAACDHVVVGPRGRFRLTELLLGLIPAVILPVVARRVGPSRALSLALTARTVSADEAVRIGLAEVAADEGRLLRDLVVSLRPIDRAAAVATKRYHADLHGSPLPPLDAVLAALAPRFADEAARRRWSR